MIVFTADHGMSLIQTGFVLYLYFVHCSFSILTYTLSTIGEMFGAHGSKGKMKFYEEAVKVPLAISLPSVIPAAVHSEDVSHLDLIATIMDYLHKKKMDVSEGSSLRRYIDHGSINKLRDACGVVSELDHRTALDDGTFDRPAGTKPEFMIVHRGWKFVTTRSRHSSRVHDMLFDLNNDPYELNNLIGKVGRNATLEVISKAEHLKHLLVQWMYKHNTAYKYYSDPKYSLYETKGDIKEVKFRRKWRRVNIWQSHYGTIKFGKPVYRKKFSVYQRLEWFYLGRTTKGKLLVTSIAVTGPDKNFFSLSKTSATVGKNQVMGLKITYKNAIYMGPASIDATLVIKIDGMNDRRLDLVLTDEVCP